MCLLFAITETKKIPRAELERFLLLVNSKFGLTQKDGFGYALWDHVSQQPFIERCVKPSDFAGIGKLPVLMSDLGWMAEHAWMDDWSSSGNWDQVIPSGPLIAHGRTSTNDVVLRNTHPFHKDGWTLAHNGVVDWHGEKLPLDTTCDSEHLLNCYTKLDGPVSFAENLTGWFATLAIDPKGMLHVAKCVTTDLYFSWSKRWETYLFATKASDLSEIGHTLQLDITRPLEVEPLVELTFDGNHPGGVRYFDAPGICSASSDKARRALGKDIEDDEETDTKGGKKKKRRKSRKSDEKESEFNYGPSDWEDEDEVEDEDNPLDTGDESTMRKDNIEIAKQEMLETGWITKSDLEDMDDDELYKRYYQMCDAFENAASRVQRPVEA